MLWQEREVALDRAGGPDGGPRTTATRHLAALTIAIAFACGLSPIAIPLTAYSSRPTASPGFRLAGAPGTSLLTRTGMPSRAIVKPIPVFDNEFESS